MPSIRYPDGRLPTLLAVLYVLVAYGAGLALLVHASLWSWPLGVLLLGHSLVIGAYLIHDCTHQAVFFERHWNARLGSLLSVLAGGCYGTYDGLRLKHMRHHVDRADVVAFDYRAILIAHPWLRRLVEALEWAYIPAVELLMHFLVIYSPFVVEHYRPLRRRVLFWLALRGAAFVALGLFSWPALLGYAVAYLLFLNVMRLMDMHQHTFEVVVGLDAEPGERPDQAYEQRNTFSNPFGHSRLLNLLVLNFGYHNAHHEKPTVPWYRLPQLHHELYDKGEEPVLPARRFLASMHRHRVARVMNADHGDQTIGLPPAQGPGFMGTYGVSFLTAI
ncbi:fatty acid desaturase [Pseudomonas dryadis]|uniref:Fatty acid desaturase n=1 Tax=Phytopseudomonas dryadis TaxID=2487520 RepID=A0A4Q9R109_9GAMM|nr:fatty acid desaturase [Pseudomonas dryadis]TBV03091.1 fatty acid desaturase [Pseudomonas dryadis]TBV17752.1 fatty acid desaturase [Pseudomonas sp. FRB 230]